MEVWHRLSWSHKDNVVPILEALNIEYKKGGSDTLGYTYHIDITESDPRWPYVKNLNAFDWYNAVFSREEILEAEWVRLMALEQGYPHPKNFTQFRKNTYDVTCPKCIAGDLQKAPFRLAKEPKKANHSFTTLIWTTALFCTQPVLEELQKQAIQGFEVRPVIIHSTNQVSQMVSQLVFPIVAGPALIEEDKINSRVCSGCGTIRYDYLKTGYMHLQRQALATGTDCQMTYEWFGGASHREYLISRRFAKLILDLWDDVGLKPVQLV